MSTPSQVDVRTAIAGRNRRAVLTPRGISTAVALTATLLCAAASPAAAQIFQLSQSAPTGFGGSGSASGRLELVQNISNGAPTNTFKWGDAQIDDECPGDFKGISFDIQAQFLDNGTNSQQVMIDTRACSDNGGAPKYYSTPVTYTFGRVIARARGVMYYTTNNVPDEIISIGAWKQIG